jgi:hypothetical protein
MHRNASSSTPIVSVPHRNNWRANSAFRRVAAPQLRTGGAWPREYAVSAPFADVEIAYQRGLALLVRSCCALDGRRHSGDYGCVEFEAELPAQQQLDDPKLDHDRAH